MNQIIITGNLTKDAELKESKDWSVLNFCIANNEGWGDNKKTYFFNCSLWGKRALSLQSYLTKGVKLLVIGRACPRTYEKDGEKRFVLDVNVEQLEFIGAKKNSEDGVENEDVDAYGKEIPF